MRHMFLLPLSITYELGKCRNLCLISRLTPTALALCRGCHLPGASRTFGPASPQAIEFQGFQPAFPLAPQGIRSRSVPWDGTPERGIAIECNVGAGPDGAQLVSSSTFENRHSNFGEFSVRHSTFPCWLKLGFLMEKSCSINIRRRYRYRYRFRPRPR